jgi:hypothetical protein
MKSNSEMSASQSYQYTKLLPGELRYLSLDPGSDNKPLSCTLHTTPLAEATFEAVSYVWGSDVKDQQIVCDGHVLQITTSLFKVLQRVRQADAPRNLWADMICINQEDRDEKGEQVAIMGQIYRRATRVLILIGSNNHGHGDRVRSLLDGVCTFLENVLSEIPTGWNTFPYPLDDDPILTDVRWESIRLLLSESWFERGWGE